MLSGRYLIFFSTIISRSDFSACETTKGQGPNAPANQSVWAPHTPVCDSTCRGQLFIAIHSYSLMGPETNRNIRKVFPFFLPFKVFPFFLPFCWPQKRYFRCVDCWISPKGISRHANGADFVVSAPSGCLQGRPQWGYQAWNAICVSQKLPTKQGLDMAWRLDSRALPCLCCGKVCVCVCLCVHVLVKFPDASSEWRLQSTNAWLHYFWREQRSRKATSDTPRNLLILTCKEKSRYPTRNHPCNPCNLCSGKKSSARHCKARIPKSTSIIWHQIISNHDHACNLSFKALSLRVGQKDLLNDTWHWDHWAAVHDPPAISGSLWFQCLGLLNPHGVSMWDHVGSDP